MRKLIESTLVTLDGVIEAPERWALFDAESSALSLAPASAFLLSSRSCFKASSQIATNGVSRSVPTDDCFAIGGVPL